MRRRPLAGGAMVTLVPTDPSASSARGMSVSNDAMVYANTGRDRDVAFRFSPGGAQATIQLRSPASPRSYRWKVGGRQVRALVRQRDGSVAAEGASGALLGALAPSATDARGKQLRVSSHVAGRSLSVTVDLSRSSIAYPVEIHERFIDVSRRAVAKTAADNPWCIGPVYRSGMNIFDIDTTTLHHIRWGAQWSPSATYRVNSLSSIGYQYINNNATDQTYSKYNVHPQYTFHSAIAYYKIVGGGSRVYEVHRNDYYQLYFQSWGNGFYGYATRGCWVG